MQANDFRDPNLDDTSAEDNDMQCNAMIYLTALLDAKCFADFDFLVTATIEQRAAHAVLPD